VSAFAVARAGLTSGRDLVELRRARLVEIAGSGRPREQVEALLHGSTQFYNPHKERCVIRMAPADPLPCAPDARVLVVWEHGGVRRPAAERWWRHETGEAVEVREATVWMLRFEPGADAEAALRDLGSLRDARHGLLCNPWSQGMSAGAVNAALPWIPAAEAASRDAAPPIATLPRGTS
jgi:hypothetical protein